MSDPKLLMSATVVAAVMVLGISTRGAIHRLELSPEQRRRTKNVAGYVAVLLLALGLAIVWADELQSAAIVASGFAVAIVLFSKDIILSALGWWMKTAAGAYRIGDRIRVGEWLGDVIDYGLLSTSLMEVDTRAPHGMRTGNIVTFPNALLLTEPVLNETRVLSFEWREFRFPVMDGELWSEAEARLLDVAQRLLAPHEIEVQAQLAAMSERFAFHPIVTSPMVHVGLDEQGKVFLLLRMPVHAREIAATADKLHRGYLGVPTEV